MDNIVLTGAAGSSLNVGSWLRADPGPDFGSKDLQKAIFAENPQVEGGALAFESAGVRRMSFPLWLASHSAGGSIGVQSLLRLLARPGATLDVQVDGMPSENAVRFDVLAGRVEDDYDLPMYRGGRRVPMTLKLDVEPYGYWPTSILLASAASVGLPGDLAIPNASLIGDVPGLAEIVVEAGSWAPFPAGSWGVDLLGWSLSGASGATALVSASLMVNLTTGSIFSDSWAPGSVAIDYFLNGVTGWTRLARSQGGIFGKPGYWQPHRLFVYAKLGPSQALPWYVSADLVSVDYATGMALASAQPIATLPPGTASGAPGAFGAQASPGFVLLDLGEIRPPVGAQASTVNDLTVLRVWAAPASSGGNVATPVITFGGAYALPVGDRAGLMPRGMVLPTIGIAGASAVKLSLDSILGFASLKRPSALGGGTAVEQTALAHYRGVLPKIGASTTRLDLIGGERRLNFAPTAPVVRAGPEWVQAAVYYQPRFSFLKGI